MRTQPIDNAPGTGGVSKEEPSVAAASNNSTVEDLSHGRRRSRSTSGHRMSRRSASPQHSEEGETKDETTPDGANPPLPDEEPPLPSEAPPIDDDGWDYRWDEHQRLYFYNRFTGMSQWENPRVPDATTAAALSGTSGAPGTSSSSRAPGTSSPPKRPAGGYDPKIHGNYDPNADYAIAAQREEEEAEAAAYAATYPTDPNSQYAATAHFNRFTGRFQNANINPDLHNDENKSKRQLNAFFDADAAANSHDGRSLKEERRGKKLTKQELKAFKDKRREKKEEKRKAWLMD